LPKVSVVIPLYNSDFYIKGAVKSVINQDMDDYELILVSDGSTGKESEILSEFEGKFQFIEIPHGGIANAWNTGFREATGEYFTWFGADDRHFPNSFKVMSDFLDKNKDIGMVYSDIVSVDGIDLGYERTDKLGWQDIFTKLDNVHHCIIDRLSNKKVVIYGAGTIAKYINYHIGDSLDIQGIVDRDSKLRLTKFDDKFKILPPENLRDLDFDSILVTVLDRKNEILDYLKELLDKSVLPKIIFFDEVLKSPEKINLDDPVDLVQYQDLFSNIDQFSYIKDGYRVRCSTLRRMDFSDDLLLRSNIVSQIFIYRREVRDVIGEYDTSFDIAMDYDYWLRLSERFKIKHIPGILGIVNSSENSFHIREREKTSRELEYLMEKTLKRKGMKKKWTLIDRMFQFESEDYSSK